MITINREGRILIDLRKVESYANPIGYLKSRLEYFTVVPFIYPYDSNGNMISDYQTNVYNKLSFNNINVNSTDYEIRMADFFRAFFETEHFLLMRINSRTDLMNLLFGRDYTNPEDVYDELNKVTNIKNNVSIRCVYDILEFTGIYVLFVFLHAENLNLISGLGSQKTYDVFTNTDFHEDYDIFLEFGLRFNDYKPYYPGSGSNSINQSLCIFNCLNESKHIIRNIISYSLYNTIAIDTPFYKSIKDSELQNSELLSPFSNDKKKNVTSLYGWVYKISNKKAYPASWIYFTIIHSNTIYAGLFDSIVNKKYILNSGYKIITYADKITVGEYFSSLINNEIYSNALYYKDGFVFFLADRNCNLSENVLRYERAIRIVNFVSKIIKSILRGFISLDISEENPNSDSIIENIERDVNELLDASLPDDIPFEFVIKDVIESTNTMVCELVVQYGNTVYNIVLDVVVTNPE